MCRPLLVYDGSNRLFRAIGETVADRISVTVLPWSDATAQEFLDAQFGGTPFVFVLVEGETVYVGDAAISKLGGKTGVPDLLTESLARAYPPLSGPFGRVVHGRAPANINGAFPLDPAAKVALESLDCGSL